MYILSVVVLVGVVGLEHLEIIFLKRRITTKDHIDSKNGI